MSSIRIRKRGKSYEYCFDIGKVNNKRKRITKSGFKTKAEAQEAGTVAYEEYIITGVVVKDCQMSYHDYLDFWYENYCKVNLKYTTQEAYKNIIEKYLKPSLGLYRLSAITSVTLHNFLTELCNKYSFSRSYFKNILKVMKGTFREATDVYGFIRYNPSLTLRLPKIEDNNDFEKHLYTQDEIDKILTRFKDDDVFTCAFITSCFTGMRPGELCALTWEDVDFENKVINVRHSVFDKKKNENGRWYIGTTKTKSGERQIHISPTLMKALVNFKNRQMELKYLYGKDYKCYHLEEVKNQYGKVLEYQIVENQSNILSMKLANMIFTRDNGKYCGTDIIKYPYKIIHKELGIENCRFYDLRGSYATTILRNGVEIRDVADVLGHKDIETTENYYISSTDETRKNVTDSYESTINLDVIDEIIEYKISI